MPSRRGEPAESAGSDPPRDHPADVRRWLETAPDLTASAIVEVLQFDQLQRWGQGERVPAEAYLLIHPALAGAAEALDLIVGEFLLRRGAGEAPTLDEYQWRFPEYAEQLRLLVELEGELATGTEDGGEADAPAAVPCLGRFQLREQVGQGAFAVVYRAWDPDLRREVAVKVPRRYLLADTEAGTRLLREAGTAARLRHPALVPLHEVGQDGPTPYLVYEFIPGPTLASLLRQTRPSPEQAALWIARLADALEYAHGCGIVHRDVKPANVMMDRDGQPLLADFGLALHLDAATLTRQGDLLGTPAYMSPEQAAGAAHKVDARSDVYSLGVVLYEVLCGAPPFQGSPASVLHKVLHTDPPLPRQRCPGVPLDLETICLKAMAREPARRYASAGALADDLRRYLAHRPVRARRVGLIGRLALWCRRNPGLACALAAGTVLVLAVATIGFWRVAEERDRYHVERDRARLQSAEFALDRGLALCEKGDVGQGLLWLARALTLAPDEAADLRHAVRVNLAAWQRRAPRPRLLLPHRGCVQAVAFSPDGRTLLTGSLDGTARLWDAVTGAPRGAPLAHPDKVFAVAFHPDGGAVLTGCADGTARLWDASTGKPLRVLHHPAWVNSVAFSADGKTILTACHDTRARLWDATTGQPRGVPFPPVHSVFQAAISPDGRSVLMGSHERVVRLWDADTRTILATLRAHDAGCPVAFGPRGLVLAVHSDFAARLWQAPALTLLGVPLRHRDPVASVAFSADGGAVVTGSSDRTARVWEVPTGRPLGPPLPHPDRVTDAVFSPDGARVLTGCIDNYARLWELPRPQAPALTLAHADPVWVLAIAPDGRSVLTGSGPLTSKVALSGLGAAQLWDLETGKPLGPPLPHPQAVRAMDFSLDGKVFVTGSWDVTVQLWDAATRRPLGPRLAGQGAQVTLATFRPDGKVVMTASLLEKDVRFWDVATRAPRGRACDHGEAVRAAAFSRDGRRVATASFDKSVRLWEVATGRQLVPPMRHQGQVGAVAFSPDGRWVLGGSDDGRAQLWDAVTGRPVGAALEHRATVRAVAFSPDGRYFVTASRDGTARLWEAATRKPVGPALTHRDGLETAAFTPDGRRVLTGARDGEVRGWDVPAPVTGSNERLRLWVEVVTGMELDADGAVRVLDAARWEARRQRLGE